MAAPEGTVPFDVLHALAIKGMARPELLAASLGLDAGELNAELARLSAGGLASHLASRGLWRVTPAGRARHAGLLDEELAGAARDGLRPGYLEFLPLNRQLKEICTRWQLRGAGPNDHSDAGYDRDRIAELAALHATAAEVIAQLTAVRARFGRYGQLLAAALARAQGGDTKAFTGVLAASYHDIWMELHRDLLLSLRIDRQAEEATEAGTPR
jgi:hypothetical protein